MIYWALPRYLSPELIKVEIYLCWQIENRRRAIERQHSLAFFLSRTHISTNFMSEWYSQHQQRFILPWRFYLIFPIGSRLGINNIVSILLRKYRKVIHKKDSNETKSLYKRKKLEVRNPLCVLHKSNSPLFIYAHKNISIPIF